MENGSSGSPNRFLIRRTALAALTLLLAVAAGTSPRFPFLGPRPARGGEADEGELFDRWMERRHRAAPGYDWHAIEAANLRESLARIALAEKAGGAKPVWHERGPVNQTGATALAALRPDGRPFLLAASQAGRTKDPEAHDLYLRGLAFANAPWMAGSIFPSLPSRPRATGRCRIATMTS